MYPRDSNSSTPVGSVILAFGIYGTLKGLLDEPLSVLIQQTGQASALVEKGFFTPVRTVQSVQGPGRVGEL